MWLGQFGGDQRAFELLDLFAEVTATDACHGLVGRGRYITVQGQFQAEGEALGGVLQLAYVARPFMA
ncbi:hypothetical protein D3C72_2144600 [compost metagenome]